MHRLLRNDDFIRAIILLVLIIVFGIFTNGVVYSRVGLLNILLQSSIVGMAAIGQSFVILTGGIDISMYGVGLLASVSGAVTLTSRFDLNIVGGEPVPVPVGVAIILLVAATMGLLNGIFVSRLRVPALITTLGTWQLGLGLAQTVGGGYTISDLAPGLSIIGQGSIAGLPNPVVEMLVLFAIAYFVLHHTAFGRAVYAVGGNAASCYLSGINVRQVLLLVFVISGLMVGLAAVSMESRLMAVSYNSLSELNLDSIAAATIGGLSISGGRGTILGVLFGTLILAVIDGGLGVMGATPNVQSPVKGAIIILAISVEYFRRHDVSRRITTSAATGS